MAILGPARLLVPLLAMGLVQAHAGEPPIDEYRVKAAFLYNFAKFVEWPAEAFSNGSGPLAICVLGKNPFGSALDEAVQGKTVGTRSFAVRYLSNAREARDCHILFVTTAERKQLRSILGELKAPNTLTVGESDEFIASGGVINLALQDSKVRIQIDTEAAAGAKFRISSKLLGIAEPVKK